jgi:hypothetical protein
MCPDHHTLLYSVTQSGSKMGCLGEYSMARDCTDIEPLNSRICYKTLLVTVTNVVIKTTLVWVITQRVVVIYNRRFGTTYRSHLL